MTLYERYLWTRESTARTLVGLFVLASLFIAGYGITHAALSTTYDVSNEVQMNLDVSIIGTQTTGIILSSPQVNGVNHRFATTTGGLLRIRSGSFREDITYTSATIGSDNRVTLVGVTRNICAQYGRQYISCGDGRRWGKGAIVELTYDARLINLKANMDRANTFSASGAVVFSNSGSLAWPTFATTAARDQQLGANPGGPVRTACVTATGLCYMYIGGAWTAFGNTGVSTATETAVGTVELGTIADQLAKTISGNAGPTVVQTQHLISSGSIHGINGTIYASRIPILNASGALVTSIGGLGRINPSSGSLLVGAGSGAVGLLRASTTGAIPRWDNARGVWTTTGGLLVNDKTVYLSGTRSTATGASSTAFFSVDLHQYTIPANDLVSGVEYSFDMPCSWSLNNTGGADALNLQIELGGTKVSAVSVTQEATSDCLMGGTITGTTSAGAASAVRTVLWIKTGGGTTDTFNIQSGNFATNGSLLFKITGDFDTSNGSNDFRVYKARLTKHSTTPF